MAIIKYKANGVWNEITAIKGDAGPKGTTGQKGDKGDKGDSAPALEDLGTIGKAAGTLPSKYPIPADKEQEGLLMQWADGSHEVFFPKSKIVLIQSLYNDTMNVQYKEEWTQSDSAKGWSIRTKDGSSNFSSPNVIAKTNVQSIYDTIRGLAGTPMTVSLIPFGSVIKDNTIKTQQARGDSSSLANYIGKEGQIVVDTTNKSLRVMDGVTKGGFEVGGGANSGTSGRNWVELPNGYIQYWGRNSCEDGRVIDFGNLFGEIPYISGSVVTMNGPGYMNQAVSFDMVSGKGCTIRTTTRPAGTSVTWIAIGKKKV